MHLHCSAVTSVPPTAVTYGEPAGNLGTKHPFPAGQALDAQPPETLATPESPEAKSSEIPRAPAWARRLGTREWLRRISAGVEQYPTNSCMHQGVRKSYRVCMILRATCVCPGL